MESTPQYKKEIKELEPLGDMSYICNNTYQVLPGGVGNTDEGLRSGRDGIF